MLIRPGLGKPVNMTLQDLLKMKTVEGQWTCEKVNE